MSCRSHAGGLTLCSPGVPVVPDGTSRPALTSNRLAPRAISQSNIHSPMSALNAPVAADEQRRLSPPVTDAAHGGTRRTPVTMLFVYTLFFRPRLFDVSLGRVSASGETSGGPWMSAASRSGQIRVCSGRVCSISLVFTTV